MLMTAFPAGILILLILHVCSGSLRNDVKRNISSFPRPGHNPQICGQEYSHYICDPDRLMVSIARSKRLRSQIDSVPEVTPCLCSDCNQQMFRRRTLVVGVAIARAIYIPRNVSIRINKYRYLQQMADKIRLRWALGECRGSENDVLLLYEHTSGQLISSFGSLVKRKIGLRCVQQIQERINLPTSYNFETRLYYAIGYLRDSVRSPCCGRSCPLYLNDNWYKMLAWVVGGVVIFSALTFFGRRVCARNMYVRSRIRTSSAAYPPVGLFGTRPRCTRQSSSPLSRESGRSRPGMDPDIDFPPGAATHVLYSTTAPPPYPGVGPMTVQMPPPYVGKPPAYDELETQPPTQHPIVQSSETQPPQNEEPRI